MRVEPSQMFHLRHLHLRRVKLIENRYCLSCDRRQSFQVSRVFRTFHWPQTFSHLSAEFFAPSGSVFPSKALIFVDLSPLIILLSSSPLHLPPSTLHTLATPWHQSLIQRSCFCANCSLLFQSLLQSQKRPQPRSF